jgi:phosphate transport system protein
MFAEKVFENDKKIDKLEVEIEEQCLEALALHQPVAIDLRVIVSILKINNDLERIGDLAVSIAFRGKALNEISEKERVSIDFEDYSRRAKEMFSQSIQSFMDLDAKLAKKVIAADDRVDQYNKDIYQFIAKEAQKSPKCMESLLLQLSVSRHLERVADHATNIASDVVYTVSGKIIRHETI